MKWIWRYRLAHQRVVKWAWVLVMEGLLMVNSNVTNNKFHKQCLRTPISLDFFQSCTASAASLFKFGINKVSSHLCSSEWPYQATDRSGHPIICVGDHGHQCDNRIHNLSGQWQRNTRDQASFPGDDHQECTPPIIQLKKYFTFEVQVLDDKNVRRRFRASNYQSTTRVKPFICTMPMRLDEGSR